MKKDKYSRNPSLKRLKNRVLILCGGETEEIYFNNFKLKYKKRLENIVVKVVTHKRSNPMAVVDAAIGFKSDYDELWVVFDKDDFKDFDNAILKSLKNGIKCAFSNEAIEYWFLLHYENKIGSMSRKALNTQLTRKLGFEYSKGTEVIERACREFNRIKLTDVEERAQIGHERHVVNSGKLFSNWKSCTTVYLLTKRLREWSKG